MPMFAVTWFDDEGEDHAALLLDATSLANYLRVNGGDMRSAVIEAGEPGTIAEVFVEARAAEAAA